MVNSRDINEINSLIIAQLAAEKNKTAISIAKIDRDYKEETGERIPYAELGFLRLIDFLKTVPGVKVIEDYKNHYVKFMGTEDSQHIVDLVAKQRYRNTSKVDASNNQYYRKYINASTNPFRSLTRMNKNNINNNRNTHFNSVTENLNYDEHSGQEMNNSKNAIDPMKRKYNFSQNKDYVSAALSEKIKFRLEKLIQNRPRGIWCTKLPKLYEDEYKISLDWTNLGFQRLSDFTAHLSDIFHMVRPQPNGDFRLYNAKEPLPDNKPNKRSKNLIVASIVPDDSSKHGYPDDVVTIEETVGQVLVTDLKIISNGYDDEHPMVEVEVVEAHSPSFFWVRLRKDKNKFNKMMKSLGEFYNTNHRKYAIPQVMLEQGLNIACVFYGKWHRAIIKNVNPNDRVTVLFYDYGTVTKYPFNEVFYLHRSFTVLPAQAIPCGLYGIAPQESDKWSTKVRDWFLEWICKRSLWANIVKIDTERNSMLIILADTSGKDDFYVNDWLIDKKVAKVKKMTRIRPKNFLYERYLQCQSMKNSLNVQALDDQNTCSISNDKKLLSSESPLSRRMSLLKELRSPFYQAESNGNIQINKVCPTCGNRVTKLVEQELETEDKPEITHPLIENGHSIEYPPYLYNENKLYDKVVSWLQKHKLDHSELQPTENVTVSSEHLNNCLVKDKINEADMNISSECSYDPEGSILLEKRIKKNSVINNNKDKKNNHQYDNYEDEKLSSNDHSISPENNNTRLNSSTTRVGRSTLIHDYLLIDENSDNASDDVDQSPRKVEPINWDEIKTTLNKETKQLYYDSATSQKNKSIPNEIFLSSSKEQCHTVEKINESFKNFIKVYYSLKTYEDNVLNLGPEHKIVNSDVITPMVIKILNIINKPYESVDISFPDEIKGIIQNKCNDSISNESCDDLSNGLLNIETQHTNSDLEDQNKISEKKHKDEVKINENNGDSYEVITNNTKKLNYFYHATLKKNVLERFGQSELKSNKSRENSELDSDDCDDMSTTLSAYQSQDEKENTKENNESCEEHDGDQHSDGCKIVEIYSSMGENDDINTDANKELSIMKTEDIPVFYDNETLTDGSEMDVCIEYDFLSQFYHQPTGLSKKACTLKEINSDNENSDDNDDKSSENSEDLSN